MTTRSLAVAAFVLAAISSADAQRQRPPSVTSPEVSADRRITVRLYAPEAKAVRLFSTDLPDNGRGIAMKKADTGVWDLTLEPSPPGSYRYHFNVDGLAVIDPRNPATSEANMNTWSLLHVPGSEAFDTRDVPHGAVAEVTYQSSSLKRFRRMHVYTPPGYESGEGKFPVLYLLHGATDSDDSWSTVGRAGFIVDNLIAAQKAKPMIVVMPAGHTGPFSFGPPGDNSFEKQMKEFVIDFNESIRPHVEKHYRVLADREHRAIAGLSMGGAQSLQIAIPQLDQYSAFGVFSSGIFGINEGNSTWEKDNTAALDNAAWKEGLRTVWFATGKEDFLLRTSTGTVDVLKKHGFNVTWKETEGGHTWLNWRDYLHEFVPLLFQEPKK